MSITVRDTAEATRRGTWIRDWAPDDPAFIDSADMRLAWRTLAVTTASLVLSFATWFVMSAVVVKLPAAGFAFGTTELFWLAAMPGLAGGTLRIVHTFLIPLFGTRHVVTIANALKVLPMIALAIAIDDPTTPWWVFMVIAASAGFGGGDFSSFMPSTSLFFPRRMQGTALGLQAGIGNMGVSIAQLATPFVIGVSLFGALGGAPQIVQQGELRQTVWLQNAALVYVPLLVIVTGLAWWMLRSVPVRAPLREQLDIFRSKHTWFCTITYLMTFGSFSGLSAAFPLLIKTLYGGFADAPDPLAYAFLGPLIGSLVRAATGPIADRTGGAVITHVAGLGMIAVALTMVASGVLTPASAADFPLFLTLMLCLFFFSGAGNASTFRQYPVIFAHSPRQGAGVLGWTAAVAAYGPFLVSALIGLALAQTGSVVPFFIGAACFFAVATAVNWHYYTRKGCESPS
jgi:MFS transporter, NNP family, nitrate/nitrite transporter